MKLSEIKPKQSFDIDNHPFTCESVNQHGVIFWPIGVTLSQDDIPFFIPLFICETISIKQKS